MKKLLILTISIILVIAFAFTTYAETKLTITGQLRSRGEFVRQSFDSNQEHVSSFGYLRTRVNFLAKVAENASAYVQLQDSRTYGALTQSGSTDSYSNVDIHQAYLKFNLWTKENWSIGSQMGRFEYVWGNQRLLGAVGWSNVGRSWEGELAWYDTKKFSVTFGALKLLETESATTNAGYNRDFDVFTIDVKLKTINLDFLVLAEDNKDTSSMTVPDIQALQRVTLATYYTKQIDQLDMEFNLAFQGGTVARASNTEIDIAAMMFTGGIGYSFEGARNAHVAIGVDYATGDDGTDTTKSKTFNNLYWTGHKFNGYMDYFLAGGPNGLIDIMLRGNLDITNGWTAGADLHLFSSAEDYTFIDSSTSVPNTVSTKDIGSEFDLFIKTSRVKGVALEWGVSIFSAKDSFAVYKENPVFVSNIFKKQASAWFYSQATMNF